MRGMSEADGWAHNPEDGGSSPPLRNQYNAGKVFMDTHQSSKLK